MAVFILGCFVGALVLLACAVGFGAWQVVLSIGDAAAAIARAGEAYRTRPRRATRRAPRSHVRLVRAARPYDQARDL